MTFITSVITKKFILILIKRFVCFVTYLWTLTRSTGPARLAFKRKERKKEKKFVFSSFEKPVPGEERCCMESPLTFFYFYF